MCLGIPGQIIAVHDAVNNLALVEVSGVRRLINIAFIVDEDLPPAACVGDWVLVHVGFAMSRLDEAEAMHTLALLRELGEFDEPDEADETDDSQTTIDPVSATGSTS
jgi:hydrogenase expression/formation protein HypC